MILERILGLKTNTGLQDIVHGQNKEYDNTLDASKFNLETYGSSNEASNLSQDLGLSKLFYLLITVWPFCYLLSFS